LEGAICRQGQGAGRLHAGVEDFQGNEGLQFRGDGGEVVVQRLHGLIERGWRAIRCGHAALVIRIAVDVIGNALGSISQGGVDQIAHFIRGGNARGGGGGGGAKHPAAGLHGIHEGNARRLRLLPDQGQIEEILFSVTSVEKLVVIVTQQRRVDGIDVLPCGRRKFTGAGGFLGWA
jgi:hypothetical protein